MVIDRRWSPRKDQSSRLARPDIIRAGVERNYLAINARFADPSRDQLSVLRTKVEYDYGFVTCPQQKRKTSVAGCTSKIPTLCKLLIISCQLMPPQSKRTS